MNLPQILRDDVHAIMHPVIAQAWASAPRPALGVVLALVVFALFLLASGRDPVEALLKAWDGVIGSSLGLSEVGVTMIPLLLAALATAIPTRVGLVNVGGEGQLFVGALTATGVALFFPVSQSWLMLPVMALAGGAGGGLWAATAALLRRWRGVNEVISTLLANYIAILLIDFFVFGPWKNPEGLGYPYTTPFEAAAIFPCHCRNALSLGIPGVPYGGPHRHLCHPGPHHLGIQDACRRRKPGGGTASRHRG